MPNLYIFDVKIVGITVMRDTKNPRRYLVFDLWDTNTQRDQALVECKAEYSVPEATFIKWNVSKTEVVIFSVLTLATVRPRGKAGRSKGGGVSRRSS